jgi:hypothetical protein
VRGEKWRYLNQLLVLLVDMLVMLSKLKIVEDISREKPEVIPGRFIPPRIVPC